MKRLPVSVLKDITVNAALKKAWDDLLPGSPGRHEEGGFVLQDAAGYLKVVRWPPGNQNSIVLSEHDKCKFGKDDIIATFHTHPNVGANYLQAPSETDKRAVRDDPDLKGEYYVGEFVVSREIIYLILPNGHVNEIGYTSDILGLHNE